MLQQRSRFWPRLSPLPVAAVAASVLLALGTAPTSAQPAAAAAADATHRFSLAAQPLGDALNELARQAGLQLLVRRELIEGRSAPAVAGTLTAHQALERVLAGSGLVAAIDGRTVTVRAAPAPGSAAAPVVLPVLRAQAAAVNDASTEGTGSYTTRSMRAASKLDLSIRETPQSVTVVTRELLDDSGAVSLTGALRLVPGVVVEDSGPAFSSGNVRGFSMNNLQIDGVSFNAGSGYDAYLFDTFNTASVDHIEVVRGATGLTTGNGLPSGTVNVVRKRPTRDFQAMAQLALANYQTHAAEIDIGGALLASGHVRARAVARLEDQQDHLQGYYRKRRPMFYGVVEADLGPRTTASLALDWQRVDGDGLANYRALTGMYGDGTRFIVPRRLNLSPAWERADQQRESATLALSHQLTPDWALKASYVHQNGGVHYRFLEAGDPERDGRVLGNYGTRNDYDSRRHIVDITLNGRLALFGRRHQLSLGVMQSRQRTAADTYWEGSVLAPINYHTFDPGTYAEPDWWKVQTSRYDVRQSALTASTQWHLAQPFKLLLGARLGRHKQAEHVLYEDYDYSGSGGLPYQSADYDHRDVLTPFAGATLDVADGVTLYGSYAKVFQIQSDSVRTRDGGLLDPMHGINLEAGIKAEPAPQLTLSAALFVVKQRNVASEAGEFSDPDLIRRFGRYFYEGGAGQKARGFELELSGALTPQWQLMGGYTHQKVSRSGGERIQTLPEQVLKLATQYRLGGAWRGLSVGGALYWQTERETVRRTNGASFKLDPYALLSAWAAWRVDEHLTARLNVTNLTDKVYQSNANSFVNYGEARRVWLSADYRF